MMKLVQAKIAQTASTQVSNVISKVISTSSVTGAFLNTELSTITEDVLSDIRPGVSPATAIAQASAAVSNFENFFNGTTAAVNIPTATGTHPGLATSGSSSFSSYVLSAEGGGFRAMTACEGLIGGVVSYYANTLHYSSNTPALQNLLSNLSAVTGNSGGTWFESLLGFSPTFASQLNGGTLFSTNGYMTEMNTAYNNFITKQNGAVSGIMQKISNAIASVLPNNQLNNALNQILTVINNLSDMNWTYTLANTVFAPYGAANQLNGTNFYSSSGATTRTTYLPTQGMVFTTAISTNGAAIAPYDVNVPILGNVPTGNMVLETVTNATQNGSLVPGAGSQSSFIPSNVTSHASGSSVTAAPLPTMGNNPLNVAYNTTNFNPLPNTSGPPVSTTINNLNFNGVSVLAATSESSSAAGGLDSSGVLQATLQPILGANITAALIPLVQNIVSNLSPDVQVNRSTGVSTDVLSPSAFTNSSNPTSNLVNSPQLAIADGGYVDNTGVTSALEYLQAQSGGLHNGFNITAMDTFTSSDNTADPGLSAGYQNLDQGARNLFSGSSQQQTLFGLSIAHPSVAVFDSSNHDTLASLATPYWQYNLGSIFGLRDYALSVTTTSNNLGITSGVSGTLNIWEVYTNAGTAYLPDSLANAVTSAIGLPSWGAYPTLYNEISQALGASNNGHIGAVLLAGDLGSSMHP